MSYEHASKSVPAGETVIPIDCPFLDALYVVVLFVFVMFASRQNDERVRIYIGRYHDKVFRWCVLQTNVTLVQCRDGDIRHVGYQGAIHFELIVAYYE